MIAALHRAKEHRTQIAGCDGRAIMTNPSVVAMFGWIIPAPFVNGGDAHQARFEPYFAEAILALCPSADSRERRPRSDAARPGLSPEAR